MRDVKMAYAVAIERTDGVKSLVPRQFLAGFVTGYLILETAHCTANKREISGACAANAKCKRRALESRWPESAFHFISEIVPERSRDRISW
jgi:hypothetical protein